jgi:signal transduction histidine kinase
VTTCVPTAAFPGPSRLTQPSWPEQVNPVEETHLHARLKLLGSVVQAASGSLDLAVILERTLRELDRYFPLHVSAVWLVDDRLPGIFTLAATSSFPPGRAAELGLAVGMELAAEQALFVGCLRDGQGLYIDLGNPESAGGTATPWTGKLCELLAAQGGTCTFAAPLQTGKEVFGVLQSICTRPSGFTGEQIQLLYLVADLLGPTISNCRLYGRLRTTYEELRAAQDQLIHAEKMRALGELASGMAHDFNNSLCGALGFLELTLLDKSLTPLSRGYLDSARTCAQDAAATVRRVQDFARRRSTAPVFEPLDVNGLVRETVELTRPRWESVAQARNVPIAVELRTEAGALVNGSPVELREVLTNLVFNAVDAMPAGGTLTLRTWSTAAGVFLTVGDTGLGMSPAVRQRVFEPFFTTKGEKGNGMGLSVAFGIVQGHNGVITVESEEGKGSTFTIRLPAAGGKPFPPDREAGRQGDKETRRQGDKGAESKTHSGGSLRLLVVEDEQSVRLFLETALRRLGHRPRLAANVTEGLAAFTEERFDLVFTDLGLPGASGEELVERITSHSPQTPVVLLTGWADQLHAEGKPLKGVTRVLGKPITLHRLMETLNAVCPHRG